MKYIFLTFTMQFAGGSPLYVAKKMKWLHSQGWEVIVFDHFGGLRPNDAIDLPEFKKFEKNRYLELFFPPSYFSKRQRERLLGRMIETIGYSDDYVVESNSTRLALWGELLAQRLGAKHLILDVNEHPDIRNREEFNYFDYKLSRNELFFISPKILQSFFAEYKQVTDEESEKHLFTAYMDAPVEDVKIKEFDDLPEADFKILSFGRYKPYFENMIDGIVKFANQNLGKKINLIFVGEVSEEQIRKSCLASTQNIYYHIFPSMRPIPKLIFDYSDVVIATAGCASRAYGAGAKTIAMSVCSEKPLGVVGYTTNELLLEENNVNTDIPLDKLLEEVLVYQKFGGKPLLAKKERIINFDNQLSVINKDRRYWEPVDKLVHDKSKIKIWIEKFILRLNLVDLLAYHK